MKLYKKYAFSLTELLIVLVILAVIFAAVAPIITKRRSGNSVSNESVWNYVANDDMKDAFYDPGVPDKTSSLYIGLNPKYLSSSEIVEGGKVVIRASSSPSPQRQIQFRYGTGDGINAGTLHADNRQNLLLGSVFSEFEFNNSNATTAAGMGVLNTAKNVNTSVLYGSYAGASKGATGLWGLTAIGHNAARSIRSSSNYNILVGSNSGITNRQILGNIALGANSLGSANSQGGYNVIAGAQTGGGLTTTSAIYNVILGSKYSTKTANRNTIIGYDVYPTGNPDMKNLTAVGYDSCSSFNKVDDTGTRTCIGYSSGAGVGNTPTTFDGDKNERIFLGGYPLGGFAGRSVLEVHNIDGSFNAPYQADGGPHYFYDNPTVVLNSNLAVRGNFYTVNRAENLSGFNFKDVSTNFRGGNVCTDDKWRPVRRKYTCRWFRKNFKPDPISQNLLDADGGECNTDTMSYNWASYCPQLNVSSDLRLKENLSDNYYGLSEILKLNVYNYNFKDDAKKMPQVGVVAQDLQKIFPSAVRTAKDGYLHIRWDEMFYAAINAIKTLNGKIEKLALSLSGLESDVKTIKADHKVIQKQIASLNARAARLERK